ncbi:MAG TPA: rubrerythrin family protein [bacterium]|nr:rubrerythrin family protein [bacterium]HPP86970.1 rubrerythrin family protein [bacterium]
MSKLQGTKTLQNLINAFAGESQARNRYTYYASIASKEGYKQIEEIFIDTANNEKEHAKLFFKKIAEYIDVTKDALVLPVTGSYPVALGDTLNNLKFAAAGENEEWVQLYPKFADDAEAEGFKDIATLFRMVATVEKEHEKKYKKLAENIEKNQVFKKSTKIRWKCRNCGYIHEGTDALEKCPACQHPKAYFEVYAENY